MMQGRPTGKQRKAAKLPAPSAQDPQQADQPTTTLLATPTTTTDTTTSNVPDPTTLVEANQTLLDPSAANHFYQTASHVVAATIPALQSAAAVTVPLLQSAAATAVPMIQSAASATAATTLPWIQSASSSIANVSTNATSAAYLYFTTPQQHLTPTLAAATQSAISPLSTSLLTATSSTKKTGRDVKLYSDNYTAAISLPETAPKTETHTPSWFGSMTNWITRSNPAIKTSVAPQRTIKEMIKDLRDISRPLEEKIKTQTITDTEKNELDGYTLKIINLLEKEIIEHAARRMDLFFLSLVAVYCTRAEITDGQTELQHGKGDKIHGTAGCHSTIFSHLELSQPKPLSTWFYQVELTSLVNTHFMESCNATVELPTEVNEFDKHLEGPYIRSPHYKHGLIVLNEVSQGKMTPAQGMTQFLIIVDFFFKDFELKYLQSAQTKIASKEGEKIHTYYETFKKIHELQKKGSFKAAKQGSSIIEVDMNYVYSMLNVNSFAQRHFHLLDTHYFATQREIAHSPSFRTAAGASKTATLFPPLAPATPINTAAVTAAPTLATAATTPKLSKAAQAAAPAPSSATSKPH